MYRRFKAFYYWSFDRIPIWTPVRMNIFTFPNAWIYTEAQKTKTAKWCRCSRKQQWRHDCDTKCLVFWHKHIGEQVVPLLSFVLLSCDVECVSTWQPILSIYILCLNWWRFIVFGDIFCFCHVGRLLSLFTYNQIQVCTIFKKKYSKNINK